MPARTLADTAKTLGPLGGEVTVALSRGGVGEGMIGFAGGSRRTTSRLLDPDFPKIRSLFPDQHNARARLSVAALAEVVKRVALVADRTTPVRLSFAEGEVVVEAGGSEDARASEAMEGEFTGEALTVAFNPAYLLDGLSVLDAPTRADLVHRRAMKPAVISPAGEDGEPVPGLPVPDHADAGRRLTADGQSAPSAERCQEGSHAAGHGGPRPDGRQHGRPAARRPGTRSSASTTTRRSPTCRAWPSWSRR